MGLLKVNGAELFHEVRGAGPPVLLIMGATGDGGHFHGLVELLADDYTVVTYDRRGNGRSPRPRGWNTTSNDEQADDAAALLSSIGLAPAVVFGTSLGAIYALNLLIRHPDAVRGAILHEPPLYGVLEHPEEVLAEVAPQLREAMETGGPPALIERFWRWVAGDNGWEHLEPSLRRRMLATADTFCDVERGTVRALPTRRRHPRRDHHARRRPRRRAQSVVPARDCSMAGCTSRSPSPAGARRSHPLRRSPRANWHRPCDLYYGSSTQPLEASERRGTQGAPRPERRRRTSRSRSRIAGRHGRHPHPGW